jgi:hypothetical protein
VVFLGFSRAEPLDWSIAHQLPNYQDMVRVKYRTFYIEYSGCEVMWSSFFCFELWIKSFIDCGFMCLKVGYWQATINVCGGIWI